MLKNIWNSIILLFAICGTVNAEKNFLAHDRKELYKSKDFYVFNGKGELGVPGLPAPGFYATSYVAPEAAAKRIGQTYFPTTRKDADGNKYIVMPGYAGVPEYKFFTKKFYMARDGKVKISFRAKIAPDENGEFQKLSRYTLDFRCKDDGVHYGPVKKRYPVLTANSFKFGKEWKQYSYTVDVVAGQFYDARFRFGAETLDGHSNALCIDDFSIEYVDAPRSNRAQVAFISGKLTNAYLENEEIAFDVNAVLPSNREKEKITLYIREDFSNKLAEEIELELHKQKELSQNSALFSGRVKLKRKPFGSYNAICTLNGKLAYSQGGGFVVLRKLSKTTSPMQRKIGAHFLVHGGFQLLTFNAKPFTTELGAGETAKLYSLSGIRHGMYDFALKNVQTQIDKLNFNCSDAVIELMRKYNIEPIGNLGGWWIKPGVITRRGKTYIRQMPDWILDKRFARERTGRIREKKGKFIYLPSLDVWTFYVNGVVDRYSKRIDKWMVLVEPQWVLEPQEYIDYLKVAYKKTKEANPSAYVIGGDATSDVGYNLVGWLEKLSKLGFENYLDAVSFNPYTSSTDYIEGVRFRYSNLIEKIRKVIKKDTPLWEEELYYISNSKRKQLPGAQWYFSAGDVQRHYLLGFLNRLEGITAISESSLHKDPYTPSSVSAGINALSYMLTDMDKIEKADLGNKLVRAGIFHSKDKKKAFAFIWALQPKGASLSFADGANVKFYDYYSNPIDLKGKASLQLDPLFIKGSYDNLLQFFKNAKISMGMPVKMRSRSFKDKTFYEAQNLSGTQSSILLDIGGISVKLPFNDSNYKRFSTLKKMPDDYNARLAKDSKAEYSKVEKLLDTGEYNIPNGETKPLSLNTQEGNELKLWTACDRLFIKAIVKDQKISSSKKKPVYAGDAVEVFIDRAPFLRMDVDQAVRAPDDLSVKQYVFAAETNEKGEKSLVLDKTQDLAVKDSMAEMKVAKSSEGYILTASIPLSEISPLPGNENILGINVEISRRDGDKVLPKDALTNSKRPSHKYRLHYPLMKLEGKTFNLIKNPGFEQGTLDWRCFQDRKLKCKNFFESDDAFSGQKSARIIIEEKPDWGPTLKRGSISKKLNLEKGKYALSFYAKARKVHKMTVRLANAKEIKIPQNALPEPDSWTKYEYVFDLKEQSKKKGINISALCYRRDKNAHIIIDNVELIKLK